jgi:hypothetical protein
MLWFHSVTSECLKGTDLVGNIISDFLQSCIYLSSAKANEIGQSGVGTQCHPIFLSQGDGLSHYARISAMKSATDVGRVDQRYQSSLLGIEVNFEPSPPFLGIGHWC